MASFAPRRRLLTSMTMSFAAAGIAGLQGCATRSGGSDAEAGPPVVRSIMLLPVAASAPLTVENKGLRGGMNLLGVLGTVAAAQTIRSNGARVNQGLRSNGISLTGLLYAAVLREVGSAPVEMSVYSDAGVVAKAREADDFKLLDSRADAVLDIAITHIGFHSSSGFDDYTPLVDVSMDLRSPRTNESLADASYSSYRTPSKGEPRHFQTSAEFRFASLDALVAESARAGRSLEASLNAIAGGIGADIRTVLAGKFLE